MALSPKWPLWRVVRNINQILDNHETYGEMYIQGNATATTISTADTWTQVTAGWTGGITNNATFSTDQLSVDYSAGDYEIAVALSFTGAANDTWTFGIAVNDSVDETSRIERKTSSTDVGAIALVGVFTLSASDTVQLYVKNQDLTNNPTVTEAALTLRKLSY